MATLNRAQLYSYAKNAGFTGAALDEVVAIALAESGGDTQHINVNKNGSTSTVNGKTVQVPAGTKDRGVLQINDWWNNGQPGHGAAVSDAQAFDPAFSFSWAYKVTGGKQPTASSDPFKAYWVTVQNGRYKQFLTPGGGGSSSNGSTTGSSTSSSSGSTSTTTGSGSSSSPGSSTNSTPANDGTGASLQQGVWPGTYSAAPATSGSGGQDQSQSQNATSSGGVFGSGGSGLVALVALVAILAIAAFLFLRKRGKPDEPEPGQEEKERDL